VNIHPGRYTARIDGDFVVFIIGMRINKLWKLHKWIPVARAMGPMLTELFGHPEKGLLSVQVGWSGRTITLIQHWRSFDQLERFAKDRNDPHLPAWRRFNQSVGTNGDVGIFHETYRVEAGAYETMYSNMPVMGLAVAGEHLPIARRGDTARERITADR
jgi:Domain of unknown function (DUF4188)